MSYDNQPRQAVSPAREEKSGAGTAALLIIVGLLFVAGPFVLGAYVKIPVVSQIVISVFGVALLIGGGIMFTITQLYEKATMNEAFVRTGVGGPKVVVDGAAVCIPAIHRVTRVSLETIRLEIERTADKSFITGDSLHVDVRAQFYIRVNREEGAIKAAATSLGNKSGIDEMIMQLVGDKLVSGLRTVAGRKELAYLHAHVDEYSEEVKKIVEEDLQHNGLFLESVTVTYLNQTPLKDLHPDQNIFDAHGAEKIAAEVNQAQVNIATIEAKAKREKTEQEVSRDQYVAGQEVIRAQATAEAEFKTKTIQAENERKALEFKAEQDRLAKIAQVNANQAVELANVEKAKAVQIATAAQEKEVQTAQAAKDQAVQTANVTKDQAVQTANVEKQRAVEIKTREQQIAVAEAEKRRAEAEAARIAAETERTKKEQEKLTVEKTAEAERQKKVAVINKQAAAEQTTIERQMEADVAAYGTKKQAEAERQAAEDKAAAQLTLAEAEKQAKTLEAAGEQALQIVPVSVAREQVGVKQAEVEVLKSELAAKTANEKMAFDLQVELAKIEADKQVRMETAKAMGASLASANMTIYGDPATFARMIAAFSNGQQAGHYVKGLIDQTPKEVTELAFSTVESVCSAVSSLAKGMFGKDIPVDLITAAVKAELAKDTNSAQKDATMH